MSLEQLIYVSTATQALDDGELDRILESSARNNAARHVTGMLLHAGGNFMQVLEGEPDALDEVFDRVSRDPRHEGIIVLERGPIEARSFAQWSMGFRRLDARDADAHPAFAPFFRFGFDPGQLAVRPGLALDLLLNFRKGQR